MQDRRQLIELIQSLSKQESTQQPTAEAWLREQDEKSRNVTPGVPDTATGNPVDTGDCPDL
ncbi:MULTISPECIES: hypothetical protein [unclassified Variovorax]|uniref:hypothetical protein n=1 Tax=unclassified Variovorax TaxID=663243 RepID=UPI003F47C552